MQARQRKLVVGIGVLVIVQALAVVLYTVVSRERATSRTVPFAAEVMTPRAAPSLSFANLDGVRRSLADLKGRVVMVHFWATWCEPCRRELPGLLALAERQARTGNFELIAVAVDDDWDEIRAFFDGEIPRVVVRPDGADVHRHFGASTLPDTYVVDGDGQLVVRYAGARDWSTDEAKRHLSEVIAKYGLGQR